MTSSAVGGAGRWRHRWAHLPAAGVRRLPAPPRPAICGSPAWARRAGLETELIPAAGYDLRHVPAYQLPRSVNLNLVRTPDRMLRSARAARAILDEVEADVVVGFGGYVSVPAYLAAWRRHTPLVIHEVNVPPGVANRLGMRFTKHVAVGFPHQPQQSAVAARRGAWSACRCARRSPRLDRAAVRERARAHFGLDPHRPDPVRLRRLAGRPLDQPGRGRRGQGAHRGRHPGAARDRRPQRGRRVPGRAAGALRSREVHQRDGARLRRGRPGAVPRWRA